MEAEMVAADPVIITKIEVVEEIIRDVSKAMTDVLLTMIEEVTTLLDSMMVIDLNLRKTIEESLCIKFLFLTL